MALQYAAAVVGATGGVRPAGTLVWAVTGGQKTACDTQTGPNPGTNGITAIYTCVLNAANTGDYTVTATYPGDSNYTSLATTSPTTVTIPKVTPTAVLAGVGDGTLNGNAVFTLTVTGPTGATAPTGTPIFTFDAINETSGVTACDAPPTVTVSGSVTTYVCNVTESSYGTYIVTATFVGDSNYLASVSNTVTVAVQSLVPVFHIVTTASGSPTLGGTTKLIAVVEGPIGTATAATPHLTYSCAAGSGYLSGTNCVIDPVTTPATLTCASGTVSGTDCVDGLGAVIGSATYICAVGTGTLSGSDCIVAGSSTAATPTTTYTCPLGTRQAGAQCFTGDFIPAGSMNWTVTNPVGVSVTCTTVPSGEDHSGDTIPTNAYACTFPTASAGSYHATANFPGDGNYDAANSSPITIVVPHVTPTITVTGAALSNVYRAPITFTAVLTGVTGSVAPTGAITWNVFLGSTPQTCAANGGPSVTGVNATYTCTINVNAPGTYTGNISFAGDSNYLAVANSSTASVDVGPATPTISFNVTPAAPVLGDTITVQATVNPSPSGPSPTGAILWTIVGPTGTQSNLASTPANTSNIQSLTFIAANAGTYTITASYPGDNNYYATSQSAAAIVIAKVYPVVTILHSGSPSPGGNVTFNAIVQGVANATPPTATTSFFTWNTAIGTGNTSTCVPGTPSFSSANAAVFSCTEGPLSTVGTYGATGTFAGDNNYFPNTALSADVVTITSSDAAFLPITLGQVTGFHASPGGFGAVLPVTLNWDPLAGAGNYIVQAGTSTSNYQTVACLNSAATTCSVPNLIAGTKYYFWVNGYQLDGSNVRIGQGLPATTTITLDPYFPPPVIPPAGGSPTILVPLPLAAPSMTGVGADKQVTLSWTTIKDDNRKSYFLDYSVDGQTWSKAVTVNGTATSAVVTGLTNGVSTIFRLTPSGDGGTGVAAIVSVTPGVVAQPPTALTAQAGDGQVDLSWTAPVDTGGLKINNYVIESSTDGTNWTLASSTPGDTTQVNLQGLKNFTNYTFRVSAITNFGKGLPAVLSATASALPSAPLALHIVSTASQTVTIGWALPAGAPAGAITGFQVEKSVDGAAWTAVQTASGTSLSSTLTGLVNGTTYEIRVTPISGAGLGASSVIIAAPGAAPDVVKTLSATAGDKKVTLNFATPANNGGYSVDYYSVQSATSANGPWTLIIPNTGSSLTTVSVGNLKNGTTYFFRVSAVNQIGSGQYSAVASATPQPAAPAPLVTLFVMSNTTAKFGWTPAANSNTKLILKYLVETSADGLKWTTAATLPATTRTYTLTRLKTALLVRIRAVTSIGPGVPTLGTRVPGTAPTPGTTTTTTGKTGTTKTTAPSKTPATKAPTKPTSTKSTTSGALKTTTP